MHEPSPHRWQAWRHTWTAEAHDDAMNTRDGLRNRMTLPLQPTVLPLAAPAELRAETPGPDGIRHGLVAFYQQLIATGGLDTPDRWEAAEEALFDKVLNNR